MILPSLSPLTYPTYFGWGEFFFGLFSNFWWSFFQLLIPSVFEAIWIFSLDNNRYRSMLYEEPSPFVCSKPEFYCLCVMVPISYIGRDRKKLIPKHLPQATHDFVDIYHISFKLSLFWSEDSYCYYSVVSHVENVSRLFYSLLLLSSFHVSSSEEEDQHIKYWHLTSSGLSRGHFAFSWCTGRI